VALDKVPKPIMDTAKTRSTDVGDRRRQDPQRGGEVMKPMVWPCLGGLVLVVACLRPAGGQDVPKSRTATARAADGVPIRYEVHGKGDPALIFIQGWASDRSIWGEQVNVLARDYLVVTMDLAGHGESGTNRAKWSVASLAEDVETVVKTLGLKRVVLIGHSMGGPVALLAAGRMPDRVLGVVGVDTLHNAEFKMPEDQAKGIVAKFEADFPGAMREGVRTMFSEKTDPALVQRVAEKAAATDRKVAVALLRDLYQMDVTPAFAAVKKPVRCVNAAPWEPWGLPTAVATNRKYADYDAVLMDGVRHYPMLERPAEFNKHLREVLKDLAAR
jgi:pimeloyl-ACP methyl ester carboxylesterase